MILILNQLKLLMPYTGTSNSVKFCNFHLPKTTFMKKLSLLFIASLFICAAQGQVRTPTLYVAGTVLSDEKMLVSVLGTKTIEGNVVTAEINGKKTETKTDNRGHALLDFSAISAGPAGQGVAAIKTFDKSGNLLGTANTIVQNGIPSLARPVIEQLPKNIPNGEAVTIPGRNLGADAKLTCGDQPQETLSASDREMTVFTNANPGEQSAYVTTPNGVSESQTVNIYSLDFALPKNSITPKENVQAQVHYESIPVGTKLIFTNKSPETIKMTIPGAQNAANECVYTVADKNGSLPVNITGLTRGNFTIALDYDFKNEPAKSNTGPGGHNDNNNVRMDDDPCDKILVRISKIEKRIDILWDEYNKLREKSDVKSVNRRVRIEDIILKHEETIRKLYILYDDCLDKDMI